MKWSEIDWSLLRGCMVLVVVAVLVAGSALVASYQFRDQQVSKLRTARAAFLAARNQYQALDDEEDIIATYLPRYSTLEDRGIIGREQRLDWIDVLRESARAVQVPRLEYTIEAQRAFETGLDLQVGDYTVYATNMRLDLGLLHEGDLLRLLARMRENVSGLFGVSGCVMVRPRAELEMGPDATNVEARCVLNFFTLRKPETLAGAPS